MYHFLCMWYVCACVVEHDNVESFQFGDEMRVEKATGNNRLLQEVKASIMLQIS